MLTSENDAGQASLSFEDPQRVRELSGELDRNLKLISRELGVRIGQRGGAVRISGDPRSVEATSRLLQQLYELVGTGLALHPSTVEHACRMVLRDPDVPISSFFSEVVLVGNRRKPIFPRTLTQRIYVHAIRDHDIVFGVGPAGTGKTYLAMAMAVAALKRDEVQRIVLCRPAVEAGEKLGFLPGDLAEKVNPYLRPLYDALNDMVKFEHAERLIERGVIEVAPLAFMRGRTLSDAFVILDEAQNTTIEQMKMFLTRLGLGSKAVITGDITQVDLPESRTSGLVDAVEVLQGLERISFVEFDATDVVRHRLVSDIIRAYDRHRAGRIAPDATAPTAPGGEE
ncbi:MAG: PhoH family protein [Alphaproteobacteria bacterium]|nr:PhoH family protein [Alphaproteobacteria bacterium]